MERAQITMQVFGASAHPFASMGQTLLRPSVLSIRQSPSGSLSLVCKLQSHRCVHYEEGIFWCVSQVIVSQSTVMMPSGEWASRPWQQLQVESISTHD